jgi:hypothetical protein
VYQGLGALPELHAVDVIDVFRRPEALPTLVGELERLWGPTGKEKPLLWFQLGVRHPQAEARALALGFDLVADRCLLVEHRRWRAGS